MTGKSTYKAARTVAEKVQHHFALQLEEARRLQENNLPPAPPASLIETMIDVAFWTSLRREEGRSPRISLALLPPELAGAPMRFARRLPFRASVLSKLGPGIERPGIHLGVWCENEELYIWGTTHEIKSFCFVINVPEPGLLVIKHRRLDGIGKFTNVAVLKGDQIKIVDEASASLPDCPQLLTSLLGFTAPSSWHGSLNVLVQLAVSMQAHHRGGTLLLVPAGTHDWQRSISHPLSYALAPAFTGLAEQVQPHQAETNLELWQSTLRREVEGVAGLTALDGAVIMTDQYELLAFGAKIIRPQESAAVESMILTEPVAGNEPSLVNPAQHGGTRHLSAAQFVHDQRDALALVASQDGRFTIFAWSPCENMVHAHRIDTLLL